MTISIAEFYKEKLADYTDSVKVSGYGVVRSSADGIVRVDGLSGCRYAELVSFENDAFGLAIELYEDGVSVVLLSDASSIAAGSLVTGTGRIADIPVGDELIGRIADPIGRPLDGHELTPSAYRLVEMPAASIMDRASVSEPMMTGILSIDTMIPIGRGQRELIIGDRQTGKTSIALSAILNQKDTGVICVYCAIGQKASSIANTLDALQSAGAMEYTTLIASTSSDTAPLKYLAPYAACSIAEHFMLSGKDVLIVYDDLSKHAAAYREMSLLLRRPSGREAYPGDVFYLHSRLLERAARLSDEHGAGSMTALPIVETMANDISAYIPTNVISITDGQIYLETELFNSGFRPAINVGLSVSRVGRSAQSDAVKKISGNLRLDVAQYRELALFSQFGAEIDATTAAQLLRGERLLELLKQPQRELLTVAEQTVILLAFQEGVFDDQPVADISAMKRALLDYVKTHAQGAYQDVQATAALPDDVRAALSASVKAFKEQSWTA